CARGYTAHWFAYW
nr:immunoglobulin heavy chain junction region [Mus musculus]MBK4185032.1 immunoglobulin heavy chain junction region [Mus musculus]